jgi:hypothetical protein
MKKLTFLLLLASATTAAAQKNEIALSPGIIRYHNQGHSTDAQNKFEPDPQNGYGQKIALLYLRNIKWLQVGGGAELGRLNTMQEDGYIQSIAAPYIAGNVLVNYRHLVNRWAYYGGGCIGYMRSNAWIDAGGWLGKVKYPLSGFYKGGQIGAAYQLQSRLAVSADITARFAKLEHPDDPNSIIVPHYNRLNMYNFSVGVHYKF